MNLIDRIGEFLHICSRKFLINQPTMFCSTFIYPVGHQIIGNIDSRATRTCVNVNPKNIVIIICPTIIIKNHLLQIINLIRRLHGTLNLFANIKKVDAIHKTHFRFGLAVRHLGIINLPDKNNRIITLSSRVVAENKLLVSRIIIKERFPSLFISCNSTTSKDCISPSFRRKLTVIFAPCLFRICPHFRLDRRTG